jgi:hypothetical protein
MKISKVCAAVVLSLVIVGSSPAQFRAQVDRDGAVGDRLYEQPESSSLFGWFNPDRFRMRHSFNFSYQTFGKYGVSLGTYTNSMTYDVLDNLQARADVSFSYSPYNNLTSFGGQKADLSAIYLSRAEVNYKPWQNTMIRLQFRQLPYGAYSYSPFYNPWYMEDGF